MIISELEFLGSFWRASLNDKKQGDITLIADFSVNAVRQMSLDVGSAITVELPMEALRFFEAGK